MQSSLDRRVKNFVFDLGMYGQLRANARDELHFFAGQARGFTFSKQVTDFLNSGLG